MPALPADGNYQLPKKRSLYSLYFVTIRKRIEEALTSVLEKLTLKVDIQNQKNYAGAFGRLTNSIEKAQEALDKSIKDGANREEVLKALQEVRDSIKAIPAPDFSELTKALKNVESAVGNIIIPEVSNQDVVESLNSIKSVLSKLPSQFPKPEKVVIPKPEKVEFPNTFSLAESQNILDALTDLKEELIKLPKSYPKEKPVEIDLSPLAKQVQAVEKAVKSIKFPEIDFPNTINVGNFPPTRVPTPVTNININSLRGPVLQSQIDVGSTATLVPASAIDQRRSLILFNNSTTKTVYLGNENVTTNDGLPILPQQYSVPLDIGDNVELYAIVSSGTVDIRCLEASTEDQGK